MSIVTIMKKLHNMNLQMTTGSFLESAKMNKLNYYNNYSSHFKFLVIELAFAEVKHYNYTSQQCTLFP